MAENKRRPKWQRIDWDYMAKDYITGDYGSLKEFAEFHGINYSNVRQKAADGDWKRQKELYRSEKNSKILQEVQRQQVAEEVSLRKRELTLIEKCFDVIERILDDGHCQISTRQGIVDINLNPPLLKDLSDAILRLQQGESIANGENSVGVGNITMYVRALEGQVDEVWGNDE